MKKLLYFILLVTTTLLCGTATGQDFFRPGTEWYYGFNSPGLLVARGYTQYKYEKDTMIDIHLLKKLSITTYYFKVDDPTIPLDTIESSPRFFKESGDSILSYDDGELTLHWINGLEAGDVFQIDEGWGETGDFYDLMTMFIDSTEQLFLGGTTVTKSYLHGGVYMEWFGDTILAGRSGEDVIYDKFGPAGGFGYWACWGFYDCYGSSLCRYLSNETGVVDIPTGYDCESLLTSSEEFSPSMCHVYPNPFNDYVSVNCSNSSSDLKFELFSQTGFLLLAKMMTTPENNIEVDNLPPGIFFYRLSDGSLSEVGKLVKD